MLGPHWMASEMRGRLITTRLGGQTGMSDLQRANASLVARGNSHWNVFAARLLPTESSASAR
jgi:hypothetical protein